MGGKRAVSLQAYHAVRHVIDRRNLTGLMEFLKLNPAAAVELAGLGRLGKIRRRGGKRGGKRD